MNALKAATVALVESASPVPTLAPAPPLLDAESREWLQSLRAKDATGQDAIVRLRALPCAPPVLKSPGAARRSRICAATSSKTSRPKPPTTRS